VDSSYQKRNRCPGRRKCPQKLKCQKCGLVCTSRSLMNEHRRTHYVSCGFCDKLFPTEKHLQRHKQSQHGLGFECVKCKKTFMDQKKFTRHVKTHTRPFSCLFCDKSFARRDRLHNHEVAKHQKINEKCHRKQFSCTLCDRTFFDQSNLRRHVQTHSGAQLPCMVCGKTFRRKTSLENHLPHINQKLTFRVHFVTKDLPGNVV